MVRIAKYVFYDILRTRFVLLYTAFLFLCTIALFQLDADASKVILSLMNIVLIVVPLVSIVFATIHFYNSYEFIELLLAQPLNRKVIFLSEYVAVSLSMCFSFLAGVGIPTLLYNPRHSTITLLSVGTLLTLVFVSFAFFSSVVTRDKAKAIGIALLFWFYFSLIYDGLLLWIIYTFSDYPLDKVTLILVSLNPVDLGRIALLLQLDISALMGYSGAFYKNFFGGSLGTIYSFTILLIWVLVPVWGALYVFTRKDL
jgi:Cu-processing system permease protein